MDSYPIRRFEEREREEDGAREREKRNRVVYRRIPK